MDKYKITATNYPLAGFYEKNFQCNTFWLALTMFIRYKRKGYEVVNFCYRKPIKIDTSNWDQITLDWSE